MSAEASALHQDPRGPKLRVAVVTGHDALPAWLAACIDALQAAPFLELTLLRATARPRTPGFGPYRLVQRANRMLLGRLGAILEWRTLDAAAWRPLDEAASTAAAAYDVVLRLGSAPPGIAGTLADWEIADADCHPDTQGRWMLAPFVAGAMHAKVGLRVCDRRSGRCVLLHPAEVALASLSFAHHRAYQLQKAPAQLLRSLRDFARGTQPPMLAVADEPRFGILAALDLLTLIGRRALRRSRDPRRVERWEIALRRSPQGLDPRHPDAGGFRTIEPPDGWFWADPVAWREDGRDFVLVEALPYATGIGEISALEIDTAQQVVATHSVLRREVHLSYPQLFRWRDATHMLVESAQARTVTLYRAIAFPGTWSAVADILRGWRIVDATLHQEDGRWWLFACVAETPFDDGGREWNELFLFHADSPLGPWLPHAANPICTDVRRARPAGSLFRHGGRLIRPGQDCAGHYGRAIVFHEVVRLDPEGYEERALGRLEPDGSRGYAGCHTYSRHDDLEAIDLKRYVAGNDPRVRPPDGPSTQATAKAEGPGPR